MLDTNARTMLEVNVKEIDEAKTIFDELMGDKVESRRCLLRRTRRSRAWMCRAVMPAKAGIQ